eukprot:7489386-Prorocentrum_lima.AAC.1
MGTSPKLQRLIEALYAHPRFCAMMHGERSEYLVQSTGIRQGCPLSPYLFLFVMTVLFEDVHAALLLPHQELHVNTLSSQ